MSSGFEFASRVPADRRQKELAELAGYHELTIGSVGDYLDEFNRATKVGGKTLIAVTFPENPRPGTQPMDGQYEMSFQ